jgi:hypothetical protein
VPALALFAFGLLLRLLFQWGGPDGGPGWHIGCQGDAPVWQDLAHKLANGIADDQLRLPWRPPGMQWLVSSLWNGDPTAVTTVRVLLLLLGAALAPLLWLWLRTKVAPTTALLAAGLCAAASNLLLLSSGLHVETVYLFGVLLSLLLQDRLSGPRAPLFAALIAALFGILHGLLCLLRAEHALTVLVFAGLAHASFRRWLVSLSAVAGLALTLVPWQLHADAQVDAYNAGQPNLPLTQPPWHPDALTALRALPSFQQLPVHGLVTDTVRVRGGKQVTAADLGILREAFGTWPEALPHRFVALYGGLNFFLANTPEAAGGFSAKALDRLPPLQGGDSRYPPGFRAVLPQNGQIAFSYPPHLDHVIHGIDHGLAELAADPLASAQRVLQKLWHGIEGAVSGLGGYGLPIGLSGVRRQVDLVTADSALAPAFRGAVLLVAAFGLWRLRRQQALWPLYAFALTKIAILLAWFGYARQGALCLPLVALGVAAALERPLLPLVTRGRLLALALALLALEAVRATTTGATVDGTVVSAGDPFGNNRYDVRRVQFR